MATNAISTNTGPSFDTAQNRYKNVDDNGKVKGQNYNYDSTGIHNAIQPLDGCATSFGILPSLADVSAEGFTVSVQYNLLNIFPGLRNKPLIKGTGASLIASIYDRIGYMNGVSSPWVFFRDPGFRVSGDTGRFIMYKNDWKNGNRLDLRVTADIRGRYDTTLKDWQGDYSGSFGFDWYNISFIKRLSATLSYNNKFQSKDPNADSINYALYGSIANDNLYLDTQLVLGGGKDKLASEYVLSYKHRFSGSDNLMGNNKQIMDRFGASFISTKGFYAELQAYADPDYSTSTYVDKGANRLDLDALAGVRIDLMPKEKNADRSLFLDLSVGSTGIFSAADQGYRIPIYFPGNSTPLILLPLGVVSLNAAVTGRFDGVTIIAKVNDIIRGQKMAKSIFDTAKVDFDTVPDTWTGISVTAGSGITQVTHTTGPLESKDVNGFVGKAKVTIYGQSVKYMDRQYKPFPLPTDVGNDAVTPWGMGATVPNALYIKSVKVVDLVSSHVVKVYGLKADGKFYELTGSQPVTPPDLTSANLNLNDSSMDFDLPTEMYVGDGHLHYTVTVEYGCDTTKLDSTSYILNNPDGTVQFDPSEDVVTVFNNRVRWQVPNYFWSDLDRKSVTKYDISIPYDVDTNPYWVGLKMLYPIQLSVTPD